MSDGSPAVRVRGLVKSYGDVAAVRGVDLDIHYGEIFALLGPNGAGKTTTVEILEGYRRRDGGEVSVFGFDPGRERSKMLPRTGIVLQKTGVDRYLTVAETVTLYASYYPKPRLPAEVIDLVGLTDKRNSRVTTLSGGQLRRLDMAVALAGDPDLLFLDEPTTGFDPAARRAAWDTVRSLQGLGKTVLLTTHYLEEAQALADRVAIIKGGRILAEGAPGELGAGDSSRYRVAWRNGRGLIEQRETDDPTTLLHELTEAALARGERLRDLSVSRPSLEDIYLELTDDG